MESGESTWQRNRFLYGSIWLFMLFLALLFALIMPPLSRKQKNFSTKLLQLSSYGQASSGNDTFVITPALLKSHVSETAKPLSVTGKNLVIKPQDSLPSAPQDAPMFHVAGNDEQMQQTQIVAHLPQGQILPVKSAIQVKAEPEPHTYVTTSMLGLQKALFQEQLPMQQQQDVLQILDLFRYGSALNNKRSNVTFLIDFHDRASRLTGQKETIVRIADTSHARSPLLIHVPHTQGGQRQAVWGAIKKEGTQKNQTAVALVFSLNKSLQSNISQSDLPSAVRLQIAQVLETRFQVNQKPAAKDYLFAYYEEETTTTGRKTAMPSTAKLRYVVCNTQNKFKRYWFFNNTLQHIEDYVDGNQQSYRRFFFANPLRVMRITSPFGARLHPILGRTRLHAGVDIGAPIGTPVRASADGLLLKRAHDTGYGNYIYIQHSAGYTTVYAHMLHFAKGLGVGSFVRQGDVIGYVGSTGLSTGPHLHYEIRFQNKPYNPIGLQTNTFLSIANKPLQLFMRQQKQTNADLLGLLS